MLYFRQYSDGFLTKERKMSKAEQIRQHLQNGLSVGQIVILVDASKGYVRNIQYDIKSGGGLERARKKWVKTDSGRTSIKKISRRRCRKNRRRRRQLHPEIRYKERVAYYQRGRKHVDPNVPKRRWTDAEEEKLMATDPNTLDKELATELNRTVAAIQNRRCILLKKKLKEAAKKLVVIEI